MRTRSKLLLIPAGRRIEVCETQHYVSKKPTLDSGDVSVDGIARNDHAPKSIKARTDSGDVKLRAG